jgi:uncharacterized membrane protein
MDRGSSGRRAMRWVLAAFMGVAGVGHLVATASFLGQVPDFFPFRTAIVVVSGLIEIGFAVALVLLHGQRLRRAGWALAAFFVLIFPGNVYQALAGTDAFGLDTPGLRWGRLLAQPVLIVWALWCTAAWPRQDPPPPSRGR